MKTHSLISLHSGAIEAAILPSDTCVKYMRKEQSSHRSIPGQLSFWRYRSCQKESSRGSANKTPVAVRLLLEGGRGGRIFSASLFFGAAQAQLCRDSLSSFRGWSSARHGFRRVYSFPGQIEVLPGAGDPHRGPTFLRGPKLPPYLQRGFYRVAGRAE